MRKCLVLSVVPVHFYLFHRGRVGNVLSIPLYVLTCEEIDNKATATSAPLIVLTELPGGLDVDVVVAAADADDDAQRLELLQVLSGQGDGVVHHGPHRLVQHLAGHEEERGKGASAPRSVYIRLPFDDREEALEMEAKGESAFVGFPPPPPHSE